MHQLASFSMSSDKGKKLAKLQHVSLILAKRKVLSVDVKTLNSEYLWRVSRIIDVWVFGVV